MNPIDTQLMLSRLIALGDAVEQKDVMRIASIAIDTALDLLPSDQLHDMLTESARKRVDAIVDVAENAKVGK